MQSDRHSEPEFMQGKGEIFKELCENIPSLYKMICRFGKNEGFDEENYKIGFEKINEVYECTFGANKQYSGTLDLSRDLKDICIRVCNGD